MNLLMYYGHVRTECVCVYAIRRSICNVYITIYTIYTLQYIYIVFIVRYKMHTIYFIANANCRLRFFLGVIFVVVVVVGNRKIQT